MKRMSFSTAYSLLKQRPIESLVLITLTIVLSYSLLLTPILGKTNNGDFGRFFLYGGLTDLGNSYEEIYDGYVHRIYKIGNPGILLPFGPNWVSGTIILKISVIISLLLKLSNGMLFMDLFNFDIRIQAILYCGIFLFSVFLILKAFKNSTAVKIVSSLFILLFFTDINYIAYFNSFFGEAATIVFLFLSIGSFLNLVNKNYPRKRDFILFFISSGCFLTSKTQQIPLLIFMAIVYYGFYVYYKAFRKTILKGSLIVAALCIATLLSISDYTNKNNIYQAVFTGVLMNSENPAKDLEELGLDIKFAPLAGTNFYTKDLAFDPMGEEMLKDFYPKASRGKILLYYTKHLDKLWQQFVISAENAYEFYNISEGNFEKGQHSTNKLLNTFRTDLAHKYINIHRNIYLYLVFTISFLLALLYYFIRYKDRKIRLTAIFLLLLLASGASQLILPILGSGQADFGKHLFMLNFSYDILLGISSIYLTDRIVRAIKLLKNISNSKVKDQKL